MFDRLLADIEEGKYDYISENLNKENIDFPYLDEKKAVEFAQKVGSIKKNLSSSTSGTVQPQIYNAFHNTFGKEFDPPTQSRGSSFLYSRGSTPPSKMTPRRQSNFKNLWKGTTDVSYLVRNLNAEFIISDEQDNHHLAQEGNDIIWVMPTQLHKKLHGKLHIRLKERESKIDRSEFRKARNRASKLRSIRMVRNRITNYYRNMSVDNMSVKNTLIDEMTKS